jgi:hypothetical protein
MSFSNEKVLEQLASSSEGQNRAQELVYNPRTGRFEVMKSSAQPINPDVIVAPYNEQGFFKT